MLRMFLMMVSMAVWATAAVADRMSGQEVASLMAQGPLEFEAGSVGVFQGDGSFTFTHTSYNEAGTFKVFSNGNVEIHDKATNKKVRFHFVRQSDGTPALIYAKGNGYQYRLKQ
ncbi:MAG: hypothetical protein AAFQ19_03095 [Pseudomonadota bacterium]